ncbi:MAG: radical SAM protein [Candidatus Bathyarchaeota archaeon]|nr:radical SAM protein [Candidatus Bathyarchaeota archaeon]
MEFTITMRLSSRKLLGLMKRSLTPNNPYHAQWLLTRRCNYRCKGCTVWREPQNQKELSTEEIKEGFGILEKLGVVEIVLSGGNPLIRDDIAEIIDYSSQRFITTIYDNGSMAVKKIDALRNADFVAISLDTLNEEKNDYIKGVPSAWKKSMESIEILQKEGINVGVSPTISQLNLNEIIDFTRYFTYNGIPVWYCLYWYDYPSENRLFQIGKRQDEFEITDIETMAKICDALIEMKKERKGIFITNKTLEALKQFFLNGQRIWECKALQSFLMVDHLGNVAGCHLREPVASIFELPDVWHSPKFQNLRAEFSQCNQCAYLCYIFYSLHSNVLSNLEILQDQWKNAKSLVSKA